MRMTNKFKYFFFISFVFLVNTQRYYMNYNNAKIVFTFCSCNTSI